MKNKFSLDNYEGDIAVSRDFSLPRYRNYFYKHVKKKAYKVLDKCQRYNLVFKVDNFNPYIREQFIVIDPILHNKFINSEPSKEVTKKFLYQFFDNVNKVLDVFNVHFDFIKAVEQYVNNDWTNINKPSFIIPIGKMETFKADLIACLIADTCLTRQETVIVGSRETKESWPLVYPHNKAFLYRMNFKNTDFAHVVSSCFKDEYDLVINDEPCVLILKNVNKHFGKDVNYDEYKHKMFELNLYETCLYLRDRDELVGDLLFNQERENICERFLTVGHRYRTYKSFELKKKIKK